MPRCSPSPVRNSTRSVKCAHDATAQRQRRTNNVGLGIPRRRDVGPREIARPPRRLRGIQPNWRTRSPVECNRQRRERERRYRDPDERQPLALLRLDADHPVQPRRLRASNHIRPRGARVRRAGATTAARGRRCSCAATGGLAARCLTAGTWGRLPGFLGRRGDHITGGLNAVGFRPGQLLLHRHAAARTPTLVGRVTATAVMLTGKRPRMVDDARDRGERKAYRHRNLCSNAHPNQQQPESLEFSCWFASRAHRPTPRPTARSSS